MTVRELINEELSEFILNEKMTKEQQEAGQREMIELNKLRNPISRLRDYLFNKWKGYKTEDLPKKKIEKERLTEILKSCLKNRAKTKEEAIKFLKNTVGFEPVWETLLNKDGINGFGKTKNNENEKLYFDKEVINNSIIAAGFDFSKNEEELRKQINYFMVMHEMGHLYEFLKRYIETGEKKYIPTNTTTSRKTLSTKRSEGLANAHAIDTMYRKDRFNFLSKIGNASKNPVLSNEQRKEMKAYLDGTKKFSKTFGKTIKGINNKRNDEIRKRKEEEKNE